MPYFRWYNTTRTKVSLGSLSSLEHWESPGVAAWRQKYDRIHRSVGLPLELLDNRGTLPGLLVEDYIL